MDVLTVDAFYMRLQDKTLYFTETAKDALVMGALKIDKIKDAS